MVHRRGHALLDMTEIRRAVEDKRTFTGMGLVKKRDGYDSHYEIDTENGDVFVDTILMPDSTPLFCRLASWGGCANGGIWKIPPEGTEVVIIVPYGDIEGDCMVVGTLSTGQVPTELDADTMVIVNPKNLKIVSREGDVTVDADGSVTIQGGDKGIARKDDNLSASAQLKTWAQAVETGISSAGGTPPPTPFASAAGLDGGLGTIHSASSKAKCG